jgi:hypothetical protein
VRRLERTNSPREDTKERGDGNGDRVKIGGMDRRTTQHRRGERKKHGTP